MSRPTFAAEPLFGLFAGPAAWLVQGVIGWGMGAWTCAFWTAGSVRAVLGGVGLAALLLALTGLGSSLSAWRARGPMTAPTDDPGVFLVFAGVFVSAAFAVGILLATLNALLITGCGVSR